MNKRIFQLSAVFALIYFFSTNGLASLPGITISFILKDYLHMTATQAAYFGAVTTLGWAIKPLWGIISDAFPIFGYRRKSYLIITALGSSAIWASLGQMADYRVTTLIAMFIASSVMYAVMDVVCDALMVETGKPLNLTGRFQSIQWTAVYVASIITGLAGGWAAEHLSAQKVFSINAIFPIVVLAVVLFFVKEERHNSLQLPLTLRGSATVLPLLKQALSKKQIWLLAFFLFFWTFSPSFGTPFFYYAVDTLHFDKMFFGIAGSVGAASSAVGAILFGIFAKRWNTRFFIKLAILVGIVATLFTLVYFIPGVQQNLKLAKTIFLISSALLGAIGSATFLVMLNAAAVTCETHAEGTTFALLTSFWNVGLMASDALGGFLFSKTGLEPLIIISAVFTAAAWVVLPYLKFEDDNNTSAVIPGLTRDPVPLVVDPDPPLAESSG